MKIPWFAVVLLASTVIGTQAQVASAPVPADVNPPGTGAPTPYVAVSKGANQQVWQRTTYDTLPSGQTIPRIHQYTELATGLHYWSNGKWADSREEIDILPNGTAAATNGQHQAYFPADIYQGVIELVTPDGLHLQSRPLGLSYDDGTNTVLIAELTNSVGYLAGSNQVIYPNAFTDLKADLRYTYTKAGFEQDIVLRESPLTPESYGLNPATARLQVLSEFFNPPQPAVTAMVLPAQVGIALTDENLGFGVMKMIPGRAFLLGSDAHEGGALVSKSWVRLEGRQFLVEEVPVEALANELAQLPGPQAASIKSKGNSALHIVSAKRLLPAQRLTKKNPLGQFKQVAQAPTQVRGLVLDYVTMATQTNYTFRGDTTYYISGTVNLYGTNTFEGGAVLKYASNASATVTIYAFPMQINWLASAYRPVIFTAVDDNSVGDIISGSTGNPTNYYYANPALQINSPSTTSTISNFRIAYAKQAVSLASSTYNLYFYHGQIVNCLNGFSVSGINGTYLRNMLFANVQTNFNNLHAGSLDVQNSTFSGSSYLTTVQDTPYQVVSLNFTNCLMANVSHLTNTYTSGSLTYQISGGTNGFYNCPEFGGGAVTNTFNPFQSVGAGNYYLTNGCAFTNAGSADIDPALLAALAQKTTHPPLWLTNTTVSVNTNLNPQAARDTQAAPDLGYHYDPIDYIADQWAMTNATLTLTNGVAIATCNEAGFLLQDRSKITSIGSPGSPNWFVRYASVQEQPVSLKGTNSSGVAVLPAYTSAMPSAQYWFTKFTCPAGGGIHLYDYAASSCSNLLVQDCEFWSGANTLGGTNGAVLMLKNNLFARSVINASGNGLLSLSNTLAWGVLSVQLNPSSANAWYAFNNDFDSCTITNSTLTNGYNAYLNCSGRLYPTNAHDVVNNVTLAYQTGPLGNYYQSTNSPLINAGGTTAYQVGLYHYTVTTNQVIEGTNIVSLGYHYVSVDQYGNPLDNNGDGIPDYWEDVNGNGLVDNGETPWMAPPAITIEPTNQLVILGSNATVGVTATGVALAYLWYFNSATLASQTNASLTLNNVQYLNAGNYYVVVTNPAGSVTSSNTMLVVFVPPTITMQPTNVTVSPGSNVTFSVGVFGTGPFTFQWQLNGTNLPNNNFIITTVAGNGSPGYSGDGGLATNTSLCAPGGVAVDASGNLFIADSGNNRIRKVDTNGIITTVAGNGIGSYSGDNGVATSAELSSPSGVTVDTYDNLYIVDSGNNRIRKVDTNGIITTVAGCGTSGYSGDNGPATDAKLKGPSGVAVDASGNLFIADSGNNGIRKVGTNGIITTVAGGNYYVGYTGDGGLATDASLNGPGAVAVDASGNLFIADTDNNVIREMDTNGIIMTVAGSYIGNDDESGSYSGDGGLAIEATLYWPNGVAVDASGNLFIGDSYNNRIRKVDNSGIFNAIITTFAGNSNRGYNTGDGGLATDAGLDNPEGVAVDGFGNLYIADTWDNVIRKVTVSSLTLTNVTVNNAGNYTVIITGPYGSVTSSNAVLIVPGPPTITTQPVGQTVSGGDTATFTVVAGGSPPLFYYWRLNGTNISMGATNTSLTLTNVQSAQAGSYSVLVSNVWGNTISSNAILVVRATVVLSGSLTNYTFESDTTYYIPTNVQLYGVTTIEGGAIIKYTNQPMAQLTLNGPLVCLTGPADLAVLTSQNDNSVGETIPGSTGNPSNANGGTYLSAGSGQTNSYAFLRLSYAGVGIFGSGTVNVQNNQFMQCGTAVGCGAGGTVTLMNNLFYYSVIANFATNLSSTITLSNNLVFGTTVNLPQPSSPVWQAFNNDFDTCTITTSTLTNGYNAYLNCNGRLYPTNAFDIVSASSLAYQSGTLGNFYQPTNSPLIHKGSTNANLVGLYHYTVTTNQVVEGTNTVCIGFHYAATDANGDPLDTNGDGIPDYLEDANGNGRVDTGEIGWNIQGDLGLKVLITQPANNSIIP